MPEARVYRVDELARAAGTTVRNVRAYQDRGLLPPPVRQGRIGLYDDRHLARLRRIAHLLGRGFSLANIDELLGAQERGQTLDAVVGLMKDVSRPWNDEKPIHLSREEVIARFGGAPDAAALRAGVELGMLIPEADGFRVPSPRILRVGQELHAAGVPLVTVLRQLRELRTDMERVAVRFMDMAREHLWNSYLAGEATRKPAEIVNRLRGWAHTAVDVELTRATKEVATRVLQTALSEMTRAKGGNGGKGGKGGNKKRET
jgi:DNA-binding transcriptional MerR regulator